MADPRGSSTILMSDGVFPGGSGVNGYAIIAGRGGSPRDPDNPGGSREDGLRGDEGERNSILRAPPAGCGGPPVSLQPLLAAITLGGRPLS